MLSALPATTPSRVSPNISDSDPDVVREPPWAPQPGPQERAIRASFIEQLLFGGARGGGKTDFLIGDYASDVIAYGEHWRGIIFRHTYAELDEIVDRGKQILFNLFPGTEFKVGKSIFVCPNGATLRLRHLAEDKDAEHYQGHCVSEGTPVLMADGSYKAIEQVQVGELVDTLEGPRRVTHTHDIGIKNCVSLRDGQTELQCHPVDHPILTTSSWQSYASLLDNDATATYTISRGGLRLPSAHVSAVLARHIPGRELPPLTALGQSTLCPLSSGHFERFAANNPTWSPPGFALSEDLWQDAGVDPERPDLWSWMSVDEDGHDPPAMASAAGFPGGYPWYPRFRGVLLPFPTESVPSGAPSPAYAAPPVPGDCTLDDPDNTPGDSPPALLWYVHPYTGAPRCSPVQTSVAALDMVPCGQKRVYDLTVEEVNHYITTKQHIINRNSYPWIGFDELPNWPTDAAFRKLKACLRSGHYIPNKRIRCTGNPGGVGHQWVRAYFKIPAIDKPDGELIKDKDGARLFIRSLVTDNKILLQNDPDYVKRLEGVGDEQLVAAWLRGDWDAFVGQYFTNWDNKNIEVESFEVPDSWPLYAAMDYGESNPTSFGLYTTDFDGVHYRISEYYKGDASASQHAYDISVSLATLPFISQGRKPSQIYADPSMWVKRRLSESVQHSPADVFADHGLYLTKANNDRVTGWRVINDLLVKDGFKMFKGWNDNLARTAPAAPRCNKNPEDIDTHCEDHALDELRYFAINAYAPVKAPQRGNTDPFLGGNVIKTMTAKRRNSKRSNPFHAR